MRMNRRVKNGALGREFSELQQQQIIRIRVEVVSLDGTAVKVHPDGAGSLENGQQVIGKARAGWTIRIHMVTADARTAVRLALSPGNTSNAPGGRELLKRAMLLAKYVVMDRALCERRNTPAGVRFCLTFADPYRSNRIESWEYER